MTAAPPLPRLLHSDRHDPAAARALQRAHRAGRLHRLRAGIFVPVRDWEGLDDADRHRLRARATASTLAATSVFSHETAAVLHGWPLTGPAPARVHVVDPTLSATLHREGVVLHGNASLIRPAVHTFSGVPVASRIDTAVQVATSSTPGSAVVTLGAAVRRREIEIDELLRALPPPPSRGSRRARRVVAALDPAHESAGEDLTELRLRDLGLEDIVVQHEFRHPDGTVDRVDFWLPDLGAVVEFDGRVKYEDERILAGRSPRDVLWREKIREDRIRALPQVRTVVRPRWWHLLDLDRLRALMRQHRVPVR